MATYIAGVTDYIPQVQPFKPDFNWYQDVMQRKQQKFDIGWNKVNTMYNSLLNAPMTRADNQEARDKFFTDAQMEIERLGSIDLSLEQNVASAYEVFKPFYEDDYMVNDMSWTRSYNDAKMKANSFKNCTDPEKCGGRYWDGGVQYLEYQRKNFMDSSAEDALNFARPEYIADPDIQGLAEKYFDESKLSITQDIDTGQWIVRQENGAPLIPQLSSYLASRLGSDQKVLDYYKVRAFLLRQSDPEKAQEIYDKRTSQTELTAEERASGVKAEEKKQNDTVAKQNFRNSADYLKAKAGSEKARLKYLSKRRAHLAEKYGKKGLDMSTLPQHVQDEFKALDDAILTQNGIAKYFADGANLARSVEKIEGDATIQMDNVVANALLNRDISVTASTLAYRNFKQTRKANPYAVARYNSQLAQGRESKQKIYDLIKLKWEAGQDQKKQQAEFWRNFLIDGDINKIMLFLGGMDSATGPGGGKSGSSPLIEKLQEQLFPSIDDSEFKELEAAISMLYPQQAPLAYSAAGGPFYNSYQGYKPPVVTGAGGSSTGAGSATTKEGGSTKTDTDDIKLNPNALPARHAAAAKKFGLTNQQYAEAYNKAVDNAETLQVQDANLQKVLGQAPINKESTESSVYQTTGEIINNLYPVDKGSTSVSTTSAESFNTNYLLDLAFDDRTSGTATEFFNKTLNAGFTTSGNMFGGWGGSAHESLRLTDLFINAGNNQLRRYMEADLNQADNVAYDASKKIINSLLDVSAIDVNNFGQDDSKRIDVEKSQFALIEMGSDIDAAINELKQQEKESGKKQTLITKRGMEAFESWPSFSDTNWHIWFNKNKGAIIENNNLIKLLGGSSTGDNSRIGGSSRRFLNRYFSSKNASFVFDRGLLGANRGPLINDKISNTEVPFVTDDGEQIKIISEQKYLELTKRDQESYWRNSKVEKLTPDELADIARYEAAEASGYTAPKLTSEDLREVSFLKPLFNGEDGFSLEQAKKYINTVHDNKTLLEDRFNENLKLAYERLVELKGYNSLTPETDTEELNIQDVVVAAISENLGKIGPDGKFIKRTNDQIMNGVYDDIITKSDRYTQFGFRLSDALPQEYGGKIIGNQIRRGNLGAYSDVKTGFGATVSDIETDIGFQFTAENLFKYVFDLGLSEITANPKYELDHPTIKGGGSYHTMFTTGKNDVMFDELSDFANKLTGNQMQLQVYHEPYGYKTGEKAFTRVGQAELDEKPEWGNLYEKSLNESIIAPIREAYKNGEIEISRTPQDLILKNKSDESEVIIPLSELNMAEAFSEINTEITDEITNMEIGPNSNPYKIFIEQYLAQPSPYSAVDGIGTTSIPARVYTASPKLMFENTESGTYIKEELQELLDIGGDEKLLDGTYKVDLINGKGDSGDELDISTNQALQVIKDVLAVNLAGIQDNSDETIKREMNLKVTVAPGSLSQNDYWSERFNVKKVTISGLKDYYKHKQGSEGKRNNSGVLYNLGYNQKVGTGASATWTENPFPDEITFKVYNSQTQTALAGLDKDPYLMSLSLNKPVVINDFEGSAGSISFIPNVNLTDATKSTVSLSPSLKKFNIETGAYESDDNANNSFIEFLSNNYGIMTGDMPIDRIDNETITLAYDFLKTHRIQNLMLEQAYPAIRKAQMEGNQVLIEALLQNLNDNLRKINY